MLLVMNVSSLIVVLISVLIVMLVSSSSGSVSWLCDVVSW